MAKLVIFCKDNEHPNAVVNVRDCYKTGDIVSVYDDDFPVPTGIKPPLFKVVQVPNTKSEVEYLISVDEKISLPVTLRKNPAAMAKLLTQSNRQQKRVRRYQYIDGVQQKCL